MKRMTVATRRRAASDDSANNDTLPLQHHEHKPLLQTHSQSPPPSPTSRRLGIGIRGKSVLFMSLSLAIHLSGYELSRSAVMALFTSDKLGFGHGKEGGLSALPMAVGCVSPFSIVLLWFYANTLDMGGPSYALRTHTLICAGTQIVSGWVLKSLDDYLETATETASHHFIYSNVKAWSQPLLFLLFVFQNAYVQLIYNQHWAFISSVLSPEEGARAFAPIAGLGSIGSTLAAGLVSVFVNKLGLIGLLHLAGFSYVISALLADVAFELARKGDFEPNKCTTTAKAAEDATRSNSSGSISSIEMTATSPKVAYAPVIRDNREQSTIDSSSPSKPSVKAIPSYEKGNIFQQAYALFTRVPVLGALFIEVIMSQCLSSLVNFIYLYKLKSTITNDAERAGWSGSFYAWINGVSGVFQFFGINLLLRHCAAHRLWILMPTLMLCCTIYTFATSAGSGTSSLFGTSASFFAMKTMEYSLRVAANESLYVSLDFESRYLGKKIISLGAGKFGKSIMAIGLSLVMVMYGERSDIMWYLLATANMFTLLWLCASIRLHSLCDASR